MESVDFGEVIRARASELKAAIANGSLPPHPEWRLEETFNADLAPVYLTVLIVNSAISGSLHVVIFWLIFFKTPKEMKSYKGFLINIAVLSLMHDLELAAIWKPVPLFPVTAGFVRGPSWIFGDLGGHYGMVALIALVVLYMVALCMGLLYRLVVLLDVRYQQLLLSWMGIVFMIGFHVVPTAVLCTFLALSYVPSDIIKLGALAKYPQLEPIFQHEAVFGYDVQRNVWMPYFLGATAFCCGGMVLIEVGLFGGIMYRLQSLKPAMSKKTYSLHKSLVRTLCIQAILPLLMVIIPDVFIVTGAWYDWPNITILTEASVASCTFHSVLDNLVMIFMITPYRKAIKQLWKKLTPKAIWRAPEPKHADAPSVSMALTSGELRSNSPTPFSHRSVNSLSQAAQSGRTEDSSNNPYRPKP